MNKLVADQADGLRRLLAPTQARVLAVAGMGRGAGGTTAAMNFAVALVGQGRNVLLLDEHCRAEGSACEVWDIDPLGGLVDVAAGRLTLDGAEVRMACGVHVLPAPPAAARGTSQGAADPRRFWHDGVVVIDAAFDGEGRLSPLAQCADDLLLVLQPHPASVTSAYAGIKRLHHAHGLKQMRFLLNGVVDVQAARQIMNNLAHAGSRYLALSLRAAGWVRFDPLVSDAWRLKKTIAEAFPASHAAVDFRRAAGEMDQWPWPEAAPLQAVA
ncbi:flagellar biosynthesis protein FlhG [Variovorax sp. 375MFSha3.1]|uniref:MinD/ParA family ATP-binding protein n=1 Tax=unclassified Variovorax TaxID=663243 RepID=UPI003AAF60C3